MLSRKSLLWTNEEDAELLALLHKGLSRQRMAVRLKRTNRAIEVRLGLLLRRLNARDESRVTRDYDAQRPKRYA